jgi:hypothetical protein
MALTLDGTSGIVSSGSITTQSATGVIFSDSSNQGAAASPFSLKNRIINGDMVIDQRNNGASVTATSAYTLDRWLAYSSAVSKYTVQRNAGSVTPPAGFSNYLGVTSTSAYSVGSTDFFSIEQPIEGFNAADLAWGTANAATVTLSFWVRSSLTGTFGGAFYAGTGTLGYAFSYTISAANTWEKKSVTITGPTTGTWASNNTAFGTVCFGIGMGSSYSWTTGSWLSQVVRSATGATSVVGTNGATFYITGVQLERNTTATPFEWIPYTTELQLCQRYYYKAIPNGSNAATVMSPGIAYTTVNSAQHYCAFPVSMRASPTASISNVSLYQPGGSFAITAIATQNSSITQGTLNFTVASGLTTNAIYIPISTSAAAYLDFSVEL